VIFHAIVFIHKRELYSFCEQNIPIKFKLFFEHLLPSYTEVN